MKPGKKGRQVPRQKKSARIQFIDIIKGLSILSRCYALLLLDLQLMILSRPFLL